MRVLLIDKNLVDPVNLKKWNLLAMKDGIELKAVTPSKWVENFRILEFHPSRVAKFSIAPLRTFWPGFENRAFYLEGLGKELRLFRPDVVVAFEEPFSLFGLQTTILARFYSLKTHIVFYTWDNLSKGTRYAYRPRKLYSSILKFTVPRASLVLAANEEARDFMEKSFATPVRKVYFGIDLETFRRSPSQSHPSVKFSFGKDFIVGYVGRLLKMKGVDTLLRALCGLQESVKLLVVGSGPEEKLLKNMAHELDLAERVEFVPSVPTAQIPAYLAVMNALVLPSRTAPQWKEQYGRVLIEGMSCGVPVIGSDSGAIPEIIGDSGLVFHEGDEKSLAKAIEKLRCDLTLRDHLSEKGFTRSKEFSAEKFAEVMYGLLMELIR
ncbi:MAG: glycosyltransferase family 4 protein [Bacteroidetes bacterium]|nr:glycosyltransferase family 4 protein [Bacteroidota bacterium]